MIVVNALVLFIGASLGNLLTAGMRFPLDRYYVRPIVMSFAGMAAISIILLLLFPRGRNS